MASKCFGCYYYAQVSSLSAWYFRGMPQAQEKKNNFLNKCLVLLAA